MSINLYAVRNFNLEVETFAIPKVDSTFVINDEDVNAFEIYEFVMDSGLYSTLSNEFYEPDFDKYFNFYKKCTEKFISLIENSSLPSSPLKTWIVEQKGKFVCFNYEYIWSSSELEYQEHHVWKANDYYALNEDSRLLDYAISNMKDLYGINIDDCFINGDYLNSPLKDAKEYFPLILKTDTIKIALDAKEQFKMIKKREDDQFFEGRLPRFQLIIDALEQGYRLFISV